MTKFNKKDKILIIIAIIIISIIAIYYSNKKEDNFIEETENLEVETKEESKENLEKEKIIVHISGAVQNEGIVELEAGNRVADAIEKAGGLKENAYMDEINLAYQLEDGEKVHIPTKEEQKQNEENKALNSSISDESQNIRAENQTKININTATQEELDSLPGIGPSTASKILEYRKEKGKFKTTEEIKEVSGIGESKYEKIKDKITVK